MSVGQLMRYRPFHLFAGRCVCKSMHGASVFVHLPIDVCGFYLPLKCGQLSAWYQSAYRSMINENFGSDVAIVFRSLALEAAMKANDGP